MTSPLRKKLRTTVRNSTRYWLLSLLVGASVSATSPVALLAQEHVPVNPFRSQPRSAAPANIYASGSRSTETPNNATTQNNATAEYSNASNQLRADAGQNFGSSSSQSRPAQFQPRGAQPLPSEPVGLGSGEVVLRWRSSDKVTPITSKPSTTTAARKSNAASNVTSSTASAPAPRPATNGPSTNRLRQNKVVAASYQDPGAAAPPIATPGNPTNPLQDPFGDRGRAAPVLPNLPPAGAPQLQPPVDNSREAPEPAPLPVFPPSNVPNNAVENTEPAVEPNRFPGSQPPSPMPSDIENAPMPIQPPETNTVPEATNPNMEIEAPEISASDRDDPLAIPPGNAPKGYSCDEIRARLKGDTIDRIELDVSPRFGRGSRSTEATTQLQEEFATNAPVRSWYDRSGREIARGRLQDWRRNRAILDVDGEEVSILVTDLSDADAAYIADAWGVPHLCGLSDDDWRQRQFSPIKMTWKSSELMHKPLYFEDVALERYGHSAGPVVQPVLSTGHFFANIAVLPYKMGIHPMSECQYALGYYRPGNCAPWQIPAIPLSGRGALMQAGVMTGMAGLLP